MARFNFTETALSGLLSVQRQALVDERGFLARLFCAEEFAETGFTTLMQINHTQTRHQGTVRGLHFQYPPFAEIKLVSCIRGEIWDVAVDLRQNSPTFLHWHGQVLSAENRTGLLIPKGFAHGFQSLCDDCELIYLHSMSYHTEAEGALNYLEPRLAIAWPLAVTELSPRDRHHAMIAADFLGVNI